jgi:hypothetical protein
MTKKQTNSKSGKPQVERDNADKAHIRKDHTDLAHMMKEHHKFKQEDAKKGKQVLQQLGVI